MACQECMPERRRIADTRYGVSKTQGPPPMTDAEALAILDEYIRTLRALDEAEKVAKRARDAKDAAWARLQGLRETRRA